MTITSSEQSSVFRRALTRPGSDLHHRTPRLSLSAQTHGSCDHTVLQTLTSSARGVCLLSYTPYELKKTWASTSAHRVFTHTHVIVFWCVLQVSHLWAETQSTSFPRKQLSRTRTENKEQICTSTNIKPICPRESLETWHNSTRKREIRKFIFSLGWWSRYISTKFSIL